MAAVVADVQVADLEDDLTGLAGVLGTRSSTSRPTIRLASCSRVAVFGSAVPATRPRRRTVILSATSRTSLSLWVMKITVVPAFASPRMMPNSSSVSNGVSTADGSSSTRMSLWR